MTILPTSFSARVSVCTNRTSKITFQFLFVNNNNNNNKSNFTSTCTGSFVNSSPGGVCLLQPPGERCLDYPTVQTNINPPGCTRLPACRASLRFTSGSDGAGANDLEPTSPPTRHITQSDVLMSANEFTSFEYLSAFSSLQETISTQTCFVKQAVLISLLFSRSIYLSLSHLSSHPSLSSATSHSPVDAEK